VRNLIESFRAKNQGHLLSQAHLSKQSFAARPAGPRLSSSQNQKIENLIKLMKNSLFNATMSAAGRVITKCRKIGRAERLWLAGLVMCLFLGLPTARAVDFHVATSQDLQSALFLSASNGVNNNIYVTNGYYLDTDAFHYAGIGTNSLTLLAEPGVASSAIALDSGASGSSLNIVCTNAQITVQGITFLRNCGNANLGGLQIAAPGSVILVNGCEFLSPTNTSGAGLIISAGNNVTVTNCIATGITNGGGIGIYISGVTNNVTLQSCTMTTNIGSEDVGGVWVNGAAVIAVTNCLFTGNGNSLMTYGGAYLNCTTITLFGNTFTGNSAYYGGGVACSIGKAATLSDNTFTGNSAYDYYGGGVYCFGGTNLILFGNTFTGNSAYTEGGGAYCSGISGSISLTNNTFTGNLVNYDYGGGFYCSSSATNPVTLYGNTFQKNSANEGGGLYVSAPNINLLDNLLFNNVATNTSALGGGIWVDASATLNMINNTVTGNSSTASGGGAAYVITGTVEYLNIYNNIIWGNSSTNGEDVYLTGTGKQKVFSFNDVDSQSGPKWDLALTNIDLSPQFYDPINGDYHLQTNSPCRNAGLIGAPSLPATDLDGNPRTSAGTVDIGCYEFNTTVTHPADVNGDFIITAAEFNAYAAAWKSGLPWTNGPNPGPNPIPANYVTRAGYLMTNGGSYYNAGSARPLNWRLIGH
jgi:hypothetical protein